MRYSTTLLEFAYLSNDVYDNEKKKKPSSPAACLAQWKVLWDSHDIDERRQRESASRPTFLKLTESLPSAFYACAYQNNHTEETVFAFRGTQNWVDFAHDIWLGTGLPHPYVQAAIAFTYYSTQLLQYDTLNPHAIHTLQNHAKPSQAYPYLNYALTGHSLGGFLAQAVAASLPAHRLCVVFNSPSASNQIVTLPRSEAPHSKRTQVISRQDPHDNIYQFNTKSDLVHYLGFPMGHVTHFPCYYDQSRISQSVKHNLEGSGFYDLVYHSHLHRLWAYESKNAMDIEAIQTALNQSKFIDFRHSILKMIEQIKDEKLENLHFEIDN